MRSFVSYCMIVSLSLLSCQVLLAAAPEAALFGKTKDGIEVEQYSLTNALGMSVKIMTRGATITNIMVPDKAGAMADVVLGFDDVAGYEGDGNQYFGCTAGRYANRIAKGKFTIDGKEYTLATNDGPNHLHGGVERSLDKVVWRAAPFDSEAGQGVVMRYNSPHGEEGYPGTLQSNVQFLLLKDKNQLTIRYTATTDQATPINLTNHSYFNLSGEGSETVLDHELQLFCDMYTPVDETLIPTGELAEVEGTVLDFRKPLPIGERVKTLDNASTIGYDHNFIVNGDAGTLRQAAKLKDPKSGRVLEVQTTEPGIQFYSGNFLKEQVGKGGKKYNHRSAICLETQHYPDSPNQPNFPSVILKPGETYQHSASFTFSAE